MSTGWTCVLYVRVRVRATDRVLQTRHGDEGEWARRDQVSHFVLRLAYCRSEELRRWLLTQECALFRHRFGELLPAAKAAFLTAHGLHYAPLTAAQFEAPDGAGVPLRQHLRTVLEQTVGVRREAAASLVAEGASSFYGVPFTDVPELVRGRRAFLRGGIAYVHREALAPLVVGAFRASLSRALAVTHRKWAARFGAEEEDRLAPIVASLSTRYLGARYGAPGGGGADGGAAVSLAELDAAAAASFPLCMRNLYGHLKDSHHLKHAGRMQLGLFLKGIGLSLEDAMAFWKTEFCKRIPGDAFEKQYAYNIRHTYGREGKRADLSAFSCMKVIMSTPGTGEHHGCPFRSFGEDSLRAALRQMKVSGPAVADVLEKVKGQHYQLACGSAFAATHGGCECDAGIQHPNQARGETLLLDDPSHSG